MAQDYSKYSSVQDYIDALNRSYGGAPTLSGWDVGRDNQATRRFYNYQQAVSQQKLSQVQQAIMEAKKNTLTTEYQTAYDEAKAANEERYEDILGRYETRYSNAMGQLEGLGGAARADVERGYARSGAAANQAMVNRGLYSTTIAPAVQSQNAEAQARSMALLNEQLRREQLGYSTGMSREMLDFMERRTDDYPSESLYVQLMNQLGNA